MAIVFCNIGWMNHYDGIQGDSIQRGAHTTKKQWVHEVCNFTFLQREGLRLCATDGPNFSRAFGGTKSSDHADGVTVIWTAGPDTGGTAIVGWYTNATVFRDLQQIPKPSKKHQVNNISEYRIVAMAENAHTLFLL